MEYRRMGRSGLQLSELSFGSWVTFSNQINDDLTDQLMGIAYDHGVNFFDNAEVYAAGESEKMMGRVLQKKNWDRSSYVLSSKVFFGWKGKAKKPNQWGLNRKHIVEACHEALERLKTDYLDLYYCHRPDKNADMEEIVRTMNTLIQQGKILYWGTSEWSTAEIMEAHMISKELNLEGPKVEQPEYNIFNRQKMEADYLQLFKSVGMGTTTWSPLASGLLTGKYNHNTPENTRLNLPGYEWLKEKTLQDNKIAVCRELEKLAQELGLSMAKMSLAWCLKNPNVSTVILGATNEQQLIENLDALHIKSLLTDEVMLKIDEISGTKPQLPEY